MIDLKKSSVILLSGGLDSTVLLAKLISEGRRVFALGVNYGQRHSKEILAAQKICHYYNVPYKLLHLENICDLFGNESSLTNKNISIPEGHYEEENMKSTIVPARNLLLLSLACVWAISNKCDTIAYAAHSGDHAIYPDCRNEFAEALDKAIQLSDWHHVELERPFVNMSKTEILELGLKLNAPLELTWSCYNGNETPCGKCGTCVERAEAFASLQKTDPAISKNLLK